MDFFELLILLLFFLLPAIGRLFGKKNAPPPTERRPDHPDERRAEPLPYESGDGAREDAELSDALRQIREALGQPAPPPEPRPVPRPVPESRPVPPPPRSLQAPTQIQKADRKKLEAQKLVEPRRDPPRWTERPRRTERPRPTLPPVADVDLDAPLAVERDQGSAKAQQMAAEFRTPEGARRALLIKEVLGPPVSRRSRRR